MIRIIGVFVFFLIFCTYSQSLAQAHQLNSYENIEATIHISPNDEPIALQLSTIEIDIADTSKMFDFSNCDCTLQISNSSTVVAELPLIGNGTIFETTYTFASEGIYTFALIAENIEESTEHFTPFELSYTYEVRPASETIPAEDSATIVSPTNYNIWMQIGSIILSIFVIATVLLIISKKRKAS